MSTPHKHAALIEAWGKGATIQCKADGPAFTDCGPPGSSSQPKWLNCYEYRVKPDNIVRFAPIFRMPGGSLVVGEGKICKASALDAYENGKHPSEKVVALLRVEIDQENCTLITAVMEKP